MCLSIQGNNKMGKGQNDEKGKGPRRGQRLINPSNLYKGCSLDILHFLYYISNMRNRKYGNNHSDDSGIHIL